MGYNLVMQPQAQSHPSPESHSQSHLPIPIATVPGEMPKAGQWSPYQADSGDLWPALITGVFERSPDGKFCNVTAVKLVEGTVSSGEWLYSIEAGHVLYDPKGPPWP